MIADPEFCVRVSGALLHSLWQGGAIAAAAIAVGRLMRHRSAQARYGLFVMALGIVALCPAATFWWLGPDSIAPASTRAETRAIAPADAVAPVALPVAANASAAAVSPAVATPAATNEFTLRRYAPHFVVVYAAGVLMMIGHLLFALRGGVRLRRKSLKIEDLALVDSLSRAARVIGLPFVPALAWCERVGAPTVVGIVRPAILIPLSLANGLSPEQVELLLMHEMAHLKRHDHWINLAQRLVESLYFFNPAVWLISRRIRIERELACDDMVLGTGAKQSAYAGSLLRMAELSREREAGALALSATGSPLGRRILRIIGRPAHEQVKMNRVWPIATAIALLFAFGVFSHVSKVWADDAKNKNYTLDEILSGIAAHEARIHSAEFDLAKYYLPSSQYPSVPAKPILENHVVWDSSFNVTATGKVTIYDLKNPSAGPTHHRTENNSWDHTFVITTRPDEKKAYISISRDNFGTFYYGTPMAAMGYWAVDNGPELTLAGTLAKYDARFATPQKEIVDGRETYVIEIALTNNPDDASGPKNWTKRFYICPELQFSPVKIVLYFKDVLQGEWTNQYTTVDGIAFPAECRETRWYPAGENKGRQISPSKRIRYSNIKLNQSTPRAIEIPADYTTWDYSKRDFQKEAELRWGKTVNGLRAAFELIPEKKEYAVGDRLKVRFWVQNVTERPIQLAGAEMRQDHAIIRDVRGKKLPDTWTWYSGWPKIVRRTLGPGETTSFDGYGLGIGKETQKVPGQPLVGNIVDGPPGRYFVSFNMQFPDVEQTSAKASTPHPGDWQGTLVTGEVEVDIKGDASSIESRVEAALSSYRAGLRAFLLQNGMTEADLKVLERGWMPDPSQKATPRPEEQKLTSALMAAEPLNQRLVDRLAAMGPTAVPALLRLHEELFPNETIVNWQTRRAVAKMGPAAVPVLNELTGSSDPDISEAATSLLGSKKDPRPVDAIIKDPDKNWGAEVNGLRAAVEFTPKKEYARGDVVPLRFHYQNVSNRDIRLVGPDEQFWMADVRDVNGKVVRAMIQVDRKYLSQTRVLKPGETTIYRALSLEIGNTAGQPDAEYPSMMNTVLNAPPGKYSIVFSNNFHDETEGGWKGWIQTAPIEINIAASVKKSVQQLLDAFEHPLHEYQQFDAAKELVAFGDKSILPAIEPYLRAETSLTRCNAGYVLAALGDERGVDAIVKELQDTSPRATDRIRSDGKPDVAGQIRQDRYYAAYLLAELKSKKAIPALAEATKDPTMGYEAVYALRKTDPGRFEWGRETGGLRAAIDFVPPKQAYAPRDVVHVRVYIYNTSAHATRIVVPEGWPDTAPIVRDASGQNVHVVHETRLGLVKISVHVVQPGEVAVFDCTMIGFGQGRDVINNVDAAPGTYWLHYNLDFLDPSTSARIQSDAPKAENWHGTLETNEIEVNIAGSAADAATATIIRQLIDGIDPSLSNQQFQQFSFHGIDLKGVPYTQDARKLPDLFVQVPPGSNSFEMRKEVYCVLRALDGSIFYVPSKSVYYIQHDMPDSGFMTFYGPFEGDPDFKPEPLAAPAITDRQSWGEPVDSVRCRLQLDTNPAYKQFGPVFQLDISSERVRTLPHYGHPINAYAVELDGVWYRRSERGKFTEMAASVGPSPGTERDNIYFPLRPDLLCRADDNATTMTLTPGKHRVRVGFDFENADGKKLRAVSNLVEIEIPLKGDPVAEPKPIAK